MLLSQKATKIVQKFVHRTSVLNSMSMPFFELP